ncbi:MAG: hypothetical protein WCC63_05440 [Candidatus Bathyarchaeia archaeon]
MHNVFKKLVVLIVTGSFVILCGLPGVLAEYAYVDLAYLGTHLPDYVWTTVSTTGRARSDIFKPPEQIGQRFLEASDSPYVGVWLHISDGLSPPHGGLINVSGIVVFEPLWQCYYLEVEYWGPAVEWNPADVNFDLKADIFDLVLFAGAYGSTPSNPNWNPYCDIAEPYGIVDIFDMVTIASSYGEEYTL